MIPTAFLLLFWQKLVDGYEGEGVLNMWDFTVPWQTQKRKHMRKNMDRSKANYRRMFPASGYYVRRDIDMIQQEFVDWCKHVSEPIIIRIA